MTSRLFFEVSNDKYILHKKKCLNIKRWGTVVCTVHALCKCLPRKFLVKVKNFTCQLVLFCKDNSCQQAYLETDTRSLLITIFKGNFKYEC
jgi:hypothetical protein